MKWYRDDFNVQHAREWFEIAANDLADGTNLELGIFDGDGSTYLGGVGLNCFHRADNLCNLGYWVRRRAQGRGVATRAARAMSEYGLTTLRLTRIEIVVAQGNEPSMAVARKLGAQFEGLLRNRLVIGGRPVPAAMFSLAPAKGDEMG